MKTLPAIFCGDESNDLISALKYSGYAVALFDDPKKAIAEAEIATAVFLLSSSYPHPQLVVTEEMLALARSKKLRLFIEFPLAVGQLSASKVNTTVYERAITPDGFDGALESASLLMINGCHYTELLPRSASPLMVLGRVAGYDKLAYGLPEDYTVLVDWLDDKKDVLISSTAISRFITARYLPTDFWRKLLNKLFEILGIKNVDIRWENTVSLTASINEPLSENAIDAAVSRNVKWLTEHMLLKNDSGQIRVAEGFSSQIGINGQQDMRKVFRGDCTGEVAMELCYHAREKNSQALFSTVKEINESVFTDAFYNGDPDSAEYGHINWYENGKAFYGDDVARALLGLFSVRELTGDDRFDKKLLASVFACLRTTGTNGLRSPRIDAVSFNDQPWIDFYNGATDYVSPHYQSYLLAVFLWAYELTGIEELFTKAKKGICEIMKLFPQKLRWQNSLSGEVTRMLLPLSFLYRIEKNEENLQMLKKAVSHTLSYQEECGAIRDSFGQLDLGKYPPPTSNETYGVAEASLIQNNGDPATDLLYTTNWALIGLYEASLVLEDKSIREAYDKLKDFLLRIQIRSEHHPEFDGAWMRSFDYDKWEYFGSAADIGWSAWSIETGWTNAWIATTLLLDKNNESLMKLSSKNAFSAIAPEIYKEMLTYKEPTKKSASASVKLDGSAE